MHRPQLPLEHFPILQSELVVQWPHVPREHLPLPSQSELVVQPPHLPLEHLPILQSELVVQWPHVPCEHLPLPLQSELVVQWPHSPWEHLPLPAQSELVLHVASAGADSRSSSVIDGSSCVRSPANAGTAGAVAAIGLGSPPHAHSHTARTSTAGFIVRSYHRKSPSLLISPTRRLSSITLTACGCSYSL